MEKKVPNFQNYQEMHDFSIQQPEEFWKSRMETIDWFTKPTKILDSSNKPFYRWYPDGVMNITYNCIDRHLQDKGDKTAFIYEAPITKEVKTMTYSELHEQVEKLAAILKEMGLQKGDRAIIYMPMIMESPVCLLACARLGVIHSVVFGGFSAQELSNRIKDSSAKVILSASCGIQPHKVVKFPDYVRSACQLAKANPKIIYVMRPQHKIQLQQNEFSYQELMSKQKIRQKYVKLDSNHPLYILYTSGTTGQPKGIFRGTGDTAVALMCSLELGFGFHSDSIMFATSDIGWVVGHSYIIYGPLLFGATSIIYEGKPVGTPDVQAYFKIVEKYNVDVLYSSPTAIRAIRREDPDMKEVVKPDISSLKVFGMVGERTDVHTFSYIQKLMPKGCLYNDTYWQTETGWFISGNFMKPQRFSMKGGSCTKGFPGYKIEILDKDKKQITENHQLGHVVIKMPMPPSFMLSLWNNDEYFKLKYLSQFPGYYCTGDTGYFDKDGYLYIMTRTDDIIQVAGHRLSTAQIEECLLSHDDIAEAAVVGVKDSLKGQIPFGVVVIKKGHEKEFKLLYNEVKQLVRKQIGPIACFSNLAVAEKLPKTRSGKILRRTIRLILDDEEWKFPETIEDASALEMIKKIKSEYLIKRDYNIQFDGDQKKIDHKKIKVDDVYQFIYTLLFINVKYQQIKENWYQDRIVIQKFDVEGVYSSKIG